ncbi:MAG: exosortase E/protease, VPEID-CTERM system [Steroidobacteraceae bacterium]
MSATQPSKSLEPVAAARRGSLAARAGLGVLALFVEKSFLDLFVDFDRASAEPGLAALLRAAQHFGFRFAVSFAIALAFLVFVRSDPALLALNREARAAPFRPKWLVANLLLLAAMAEILYRLYGGHGIPPPFAPLAFTLLVLAGASVAALALALGPWSLWRQGAVAVGRRWGYAAAAAIAATAAITWSQDLWAPTAQLTFELVKLVLTPILPGLQADAATRVLRTPHFAVAVMWLCSGLEGVGLMLAFLSVWLVYFRREYRFPHALLLIPAGVVLVFALNVLRIAALVLIGNAGYPKAALFGFHSEAGWIAFNCAACGIAFLSLRCRSLSSMPRSDMRSASLTDNPTAAYLVPFLGALAAGILSRSLTGTFETWYALRLLVAVAALLAYRSRLASLDWRFSWRGVTVGVGVFVIWLVAARLLLAPHGIPAPLAAMSGFSRAAWIASRAVTAVLVIPIVEELAYRGYLMRRLVSADFEAVSFRSVGMTPLIVSAVAFGAVHGPMWLPGMVAGGAYGLVAMRTGRMGESVAAHAVTNALLAACVLAGGAWQLW